MNNKTHHILNQHSKEIAIKFKNWCIARTFSRNETGEDDDTLFDIFMKEEKSLFDYVEENPVLFTNMYNPKRKLKSVRKRSKV